MTSSRVFDFASLLDGYFVKFVVHPIDGQKFATLSWILRRAVKLAKDADDEEVIALARNRLLLIESNFSHLVPDDCLDIREDWEKSVTQDYIGTDEMEEVGEALETAFSNVPRAIIPPLLPPSISPYASLVEHDMGTIVTSSSKYPETVQKLRFKQD